MCYLIRSLQTSDSEFIRGLYQNNEIMRHISPVLADDVVKDLCHKMLLEVNNNKAIYQVIMTRDHQQRVGMLSMHWRASESCLESGMIIVPEFQNKGVCKWAQFAAMKLAKKIFPAKICAVYISHENIAANTSYEHMGFVAVENKSNSKRHLNLNRWDFNMELINER